MGNTAGFCGSDDTWNDGGQHAELGEALCPHPSSQTTCAHLAGVSDLRQDG